MSTKTLGALAVAVMATAVPAQAQESDLSIVFGVKAWNSQWTTFLSATTDAGHPVITQVPANPKVVTIAQVGVRWRGFVASASGIPEAEYSHSEGELTNCSRKEFDANLGYLVLPGLVATVGYKKFTQTLPTETYEVRGNTLGLSATTHITGSLSTYGALGMGVGMKTNVSGGDGKADYHLTEVGLAYTLASVPLLRTVTLTGGYRMQVITAKNLLLQHGASTHRMDGRDITQGFTLGAVVTF